MLTNTTLDFISNSWNWHDARIINVVEVLFMLANDALKLSLL